MKTLERQLADYGDYQRELHGPIDADEVHSPLIEGPVAKRLKIRNGSLVAVAVDVYERLVGNPRCQSDQQSIRRAVVERVVVVVGTTCRLVICGRLWAGFVSRWTQ